ncbi:MAG: ADP-ribosylglycohydrolase family protein, partial [Alistipes sp.]|nr:ADP-ribosylglycohydrolase family protein [Alistipes sp.]
MKKKKLINEQDQQKTAMLGAICGDVIGSVYEWDNIDFMLDPEELVDPDARFTDDTVMTCAVAYGLKEGLSKVGEDWMSVPEQEEILVEEVKNAIVKYGLKYPNVGYGGRFKKWLRTEDHEPYNSWGNGSGMRASYAGWVATSLEEAERLAEISAKVTHNHPEGIDGAKAIAGSIFLLRKGESKAKIREYAENFYDLNFTLKKI